MFEAGTGQKKQYGYTKSLKNFNSFSPFFAKMIKIPVNFWALKIKSAIGIVPEEEKSDFLILIYLFTCSDIFTYYMHFGA